MIAIDHVIRADCGPRGRKAFMPFVTAGDPDLEFTAAVLRELAAAAATLCELGIPYSDPIADGPVIQASYSRALDKKINLAEILDMLADTTPRADGPVVTMVSYAIVHRHGVERYVDDASRAGMAGAIVPDLLVEEAGTDGRHLSGSRDFSLIPLVTPTTPRERACGSPKASTGFIYYVSVTGITGEREALPHELIDNVGWLREQTTCRLHRLWHQPARARAGLGSRGRRPDRWFGHRPPHRRGIDSAARGGDCRHRTITPRHSSGHSKSSDKARFAALKSACH